MKIKISLIYFVFIIAPLFSQTSMKEISEKNKIQNDWGKYFTEAGVEGTFILYNLNDDSLKVYNPERAEIQFLPASTFKILNSLISLETKAVKDENEIIKWDGVKRFYDAWNQDQSMKSGIKISCVWFYQELARRVGFERMQMYIDSVNYGNKKLGDKIDTFWLEGELRISAVEQILFLRKFVEKKLPFSERNLETVKNIMLVDSTKDYKMYAKTGMTARVEKSIGWYVGFVEAKNNFYLFALNIDINKDEDAKERIEITLDILKSQSIIN